MRHAAQYLRMSTDKQPFSIAVQETAIAEYAGAHEIDVVATYVDEARSGLSLSGREGMRRLLSDVTQKGCPFTVILVFDVTRWGRFQDVDESAYYEYHCRKWGVEVLYVAESFRSERPLDSILKQLKRAMAAEYSRELAVKVRAGVVRAVASGYAAGTLPCLGYRRQAVGANGEEKGIIKRGERKPSPSDRVRWVMGPPHEAARVQKIFADYVSGKTMQKISMDLANDGIRSHSGKRISPTMVRALLDNPVVLGCFEWGARGATRGAKSTSATGIEPMQSSLRNLSMLPPLVSVDVWSQAQAKLKYAQGFVAHGIPDDILIQKLRDLLLADQSLRSTDFRRYGLPIAATYRAHFGTLAHAYELAGVDHQIKLQLACSDGLARGMRIRARLIEDLVSILNDCGVDARRSCSGMLVVNGLKVSVRITPLLKSVGAERWRCADMRRICVHERWLLVMRMNADGMTGRDFFLLPPDEVLRFDGSINAASLPRMSKFQICTAPALVRALSELAAQKHLE